MGNPALNTENVDLSLTRPALIAAELDALFCVSQVLSQSLDLKQTSKGVLQQLHDHAGVRNGMVALVNLLRSVRFEPRPALCLSSY